MVASSISKDSVQFSLDQFFKKADKMPSDSTSSQHYNQPPMAYEVQVSLAILHTAIQSWRIFTCVMAGMVTVTF
jgi:hypothetical protein